MCNSISMRLLLCAIILSTLLGCRDNSKRMSIQGTVTLDGQPLAKGSIVFSPLPGTAGPVAGANIADGKFAMLHSGGPFTGKFRIEITASVPTGRKKLNPRSNTMIDEYVQILPARYNRDSQLQAEVTAEGSNRLDFALTSEGGPPAPK